MTEIDCRDCTEALTALMDNELSEAEASMVQLHLRDCDSCRSEYESLLFVHSLTKRMPELEISPNLWPAIRSNLDSESLSARWAQYIQRYLFRRPWVPATAALGTVALALLLFLGIPTEKANSNDFTTFVQQREILFKRNRNLLFRDGGFNRYDARRNPFLQEVQYTGQNPFRSTR